MDLVVLVLVLALVGFLVYLITTHIPMAPPFKLAIQIIVVVAVILWLIQRFAGNVPNLLP
jgi:heme A synthase